MVDVLTSADWPPARHRLAGLQHTHPATHAMQRFHDGKPFLRQAQICALIGAFSLFSQSRMLADVETEHTHPITEFSNSADDKMGWAVVDDGVMGGLSEGKMSTMPNGIMRFEGMLSLENDGGFSSIRTSRLQSLDLSKMSGLRLRVKGDGRTYQVRLESDARWGSNRVVSFHADFATKKDEWVEVNVPFSAFIGSWRGRELPEMKLNTAKIERIGLMLADKTPGQFMLLIDWIRAYFNGDTRSK